eukprot:4331598-Prymnesium_polylepis.1
MSGGGGPSTSEDGAPDGPASWARVDASSSGAPSAEGAHDVGPRFASLGDMTRVDPGKLLGRRSGSGSNVSAAEAMHMVVLYYFRDTIRQAGSTSNRLPSSLNGLNEIFAHRTWMNARAKHDIVAPYELPATQGGKGQIVFCLRMLRT